MRKPLKAVLLTVGTALALPAVLLATTTVVNLVASGVEQRELTPYGRSVTVDGRQLNVLDTGAPPAANAGADAPTIVLLPGLGTTAPALDYEPLIAELRGRARVVSVEPFGTGLSDQSDTPRTVEAITAELHEALQQLGVDRYVLMGHSIAGIYALDYSTRYAEELIAFVGIDSSVPDQPGSADPIPSDGLAALGSLGILRALNALSGDQLSGLPYSAETKRQLHILRERNTTAPTMLDEMRQAPANFAAVSGEHFPSALPVLLFVVADDPELPGWLALHEEQAASVRHGVVVPLAGGHYLHHSQSPRIAAETFAFLDASQKR